MIESQSTEEGYYNPSRRYMDCASPDYDLREAAVQAESGAAEAVPDAQYLHGLFLYTGEAGTPKDEKTAMDMFALAASAGYRPAEIVRQEIERNDRDAESELLSLRLRGEQRDTDACSRLFDIYDNGLQSAPRTTTSTPRTPSASCTSWERASARTATGP